MYPQEMKIYFCEDGGHCFHCVGKENCTNFRYRDKSSPNILKESEQEKSVDIQYDTNELVTRLYPFGGDNPDTGLEVNIMGVNPTGKSYIENYTYYLSKGYTMEYINAHPELFKKEMTWNATEYLDAQALYDDAVTKLNTLCIPKVK